MTVCQLIVEGNVSNSGEIQIEEPSFGSSKGGLISESFSIWLKSPKRGAKSLF